MCVLFCQFQRCCSLSATKWGTSQTCLRTRWTRQVQYKMAALAPPSVLPFRPLKLPKLPRHRPLLPITAPTIVSPSRKRCHPSLCPSPLPSLLHRPPPPPPPPPQDSSRWPAALCCFNRGLRLYSPSSLSPNRLPSPPSRYHLPDTTFTLQSCVFMYINPHYTNFSSSSNSRDVVQYHFIKWQHPLTLSSLVCLLCCHCTDKTNNITKLSLFFIISQWCSAAHYS